MTVSTTWSGTVAVLTLDNPPVNTGNSRMRRDLRDALQAIADKDGLTAVVIDSAGRHFYAGSDISEFDRPLEEPQLPDVIALIESIPVPVVAAVNGFALGGGFELTLGCDARIADITAVVGFPEVTLGMIPGAGGTVRAGRLLGAAQTIELAATARQLGAEKAEELGIFDRVVAPGELRAAAIEYAASMPGKRRLRDLAAPGFDQAEVDELIATVTRRARPNVQKAVDMVLRGLSMDAAEALVEERSIFNRLRVGEEARNLRYLFFAKRAAAGSLRTSARPRPLKRVGVAGSGTMGAGIARLAQRSGFQVCIFDVDGDALARMGAASDGIRTTQSLQELAEADIIIDAVFEDMDVKKKLFGDLEKLIGDSTVLVSNTSYLDLDEIAAGLRHPERFAGLHFFNPAEKNPLVEVVRTGTVDDETIATLGALAGKLGKTPILARVGDGFVANRVYSDYRGQAEFLVEDGAAPEQVDAAMTALGLPIGPFAVGDMSGLDIGWARRKRLAAGRDTRQRYVTIPDSLCERGRLGKKAGAGWYAYPEGARRGVPDPEVTAIIEAARAEKGIAARSVSDEEIQSRVLLSMVCAAAVLIRDSIALRPSDIDVALTEGFAFPRWLGGPLRYASELADDEVIRWLAEVYASDPVTFAIAEPAAEGRLPDEVRVILDAVRHPTEQRPAGRERPAVSVGI